MTDLLRQTKHVLVVDDEPDFASLLELILVSGGYRVTVACSCEEALDQARRQKPDVITMDIRMPGRSGALCYRKLKTDKALRGIPVVVVTALTRNDRDMENLIRSLLEPAHVPPPDAYVEKPVEGPALLAVLEEVLSRPEVRPEPAAPARLDYGGAGTP
ncbi:MAG TPA: response regulator [Planctomycetaceae bacterium]|nr:response regulator [Planctomycetaceae bacterium]